MAIKLEVSWSNHTHSLLSDAVVAAFATYPTGFPQQPLAAVSKFKPGVFRIEIPGSPTSLNLSVSFHYSMKDATVPKRNWVGKPPRIVISQTSAPSISSLLAHAIQDYQVRDGRLFPVADVKRFGASAHPLFSPPGAARPEGFIPIRVFTDFVDVRDLWMNRATDSDRYTKLHQPGTELVPLGYTGVGGPLIWFAIVPEICRAASNISCLVFFRPTGHYAYSSIDQIHDMYPLNRYLISSQRKSDEPWTFDRFFPYFPPNSRDAQPIWYRDLCVGVEAALAASKKKAVILIPWPSQTDFGVASKGDLSAMARQVFRLLHSEGRIGQGQTQVVLNSLGMAGFSSGGGQLMLALNRNREKTRELYAFDCHRMKDFQDQVVDWAKEQQNRLRMTGGYGQNTEANVAIRNELLIKHKKHAEDVSAYPVDSTTSWEWSKNKWWDYILWDGNLRKDEETKLRNSEDVRHQFAMFGGNDPNRMQGFLAEFLNASAL